MFIVIVLVVAAAFTAALALGLSIQERERVRSSLRQLESYEIASTRDQEMLSPLSERLSKALAGGMSSVARRFTPQGYVEGVRRKILLAGSPAGIEVDRILVLKVFGAASGLLWIPLVLILGLSGPLAVFAVALIWFTSFMLPDISLDRRVTERQNAIRRSLPDLLDLLVISVEAGLGFEQALERTASAVAGPLADEFRRFLQETRLGASRSDALRAVDERTDVLELRSFILAMLQADTFGISVSRILRSQADEMRVRRRQYAQETAQKAPIKMLAPLVLCIFPGIFVVVLLPAMIQISEQL